MKLEPIEKGIIGWKKRQAQNMILDILSRATTPQTCYQVTNKATRRNKSTGKPLEARSITPGYVGGLMIEMCKPMEILEKFGYDEDGDAMYQIPVEEVEL